MFRQNYSMNAVIGKLLFICLARDLPTIFKKMLVATFSGLVSKSISKHNVKAIIIKKNFKWYLTE